MPGAPPDPPPAEEKPDMQSNDSIDLTRVGPGTVMGAFMRQYWMPACSLPK
jgi:hypothetical protein